MNCVVVSFRIYADIKHIRTYPSPSSLLSSSVIERWVELSGVNMAVFGLLLVSLGAEIPDTIESVSVAKKGYGSMAVANCQGTQVINIAIGLGLSWLIACTHSEIRLSPILMCVHVKS